MRSTLALASTALVGALVAGCSNSGPAAPAGPPPGAPSGQWNGILVGADTQIPVGVDFEGTRATITIPSQGVFETPVAQVDLHPAAITFALPDAPGAPTFRGHYDSGLRRITGTLTQSGKDIPLTLEPGAVALPARPQQPLPPYPYRSEDVDFHSDPRVPLSGTLTLPLTPGRHPAVVLIDGSGPLDRDESVAGHKPYLLLADTLTRAGYAVLRFDKRGVGRSGGTLAASSYTDLANDIAAAVGLLRARPDIQLDRIGLFGHSEGGYLAPLVASRPESHVAFVVMMAGPATTGSEVVLDQNRRIAQAQGAGADAIAAQVGYVMSLNSLIRMGDTEAVRRFVADHNAALPPERQQSAAALDPLSDTYFDALIRYDPAPALCALRVPVLAFYGSKDLQVSAAENSPRARQLLANSPAADVHVFPGLNHLMQPAETGLPEEYATIETTIAPEVLDYVTAWLRAHAPTP